MGLLPPVEVFLTLFLVGAITVFFLYRKFKDLQLQSSSCVLSKDWSAWGECSRNCGNGGWEFSTKTVLQLESYGGTPCRLEDMLRSQSCPGNSLTCGKSCVPGDPSLYTWSSCPTCTRPNELPQQWKIVPPFSPATTGGRDCAISDVLFSNTCNNVVQACPPDIDCKLEFYYSSSCALGPCENTGQTGLQFLYFRIEQQKSGRGQECDFRQLVQIAACTDENSQCDCSSNPNDWGAFSECNASCGPGVQVALRKIPSANCPNVSFTSCSYGPCENTQCIPPSIDLVRAECYLQCAGLPTSSFAPGLCSATSILDSVCSDLRTGDNCAEPQDCSLSTWSQFAPCPMQCTPENLFGTQTERQRFIVFPSVGSGQPCTDPSLVTQDYEPCANWINVSYTKFNTDTNNFEKSVSLAQCFTQTCTYSDWYSVTSCQNPQMCSDSNFPNAYITYNRSITGGSNCFTDPNKYFSQSECKLPACTNCMWSSVGANGIDNAFRAAQCAQANRIEGFLTNTLVSNTNRFNDSCDNYNQSCSANEGVTLSPSEQQQCSVFYWDCPNLDNCPFDSNNRLCSGNGVREFYISQSSLECRCECFPDYSGVSCSTFLGRCPIASVSGLQCNGMGSCSADPQNPGSFKCFCFNTLNTSSDCSGADSVETMDRGWCWIYESVMTQGQESMGLTLKKLLGAQRISQQFTAESCTQLSARSKNLGVVLATSFTEAYENVFLFKPKNYDFNIGVAPGLQNINQSLSIISAFLEGKVQAQSPPNLFLGSSSYFPLVNDITSQDILLGLGYSLPTDEIIGNSTLSANYISFKPVVVKNSSPVTVESPLYFSSFVNPSGVNPQNLSLSDPLSQTQFIIPPQQGNVISVVPQAGTYTQVRWLNFNDFIGASPTASVYNPTLPPNILDPASPPIAVSNNYSFYYMPQEQYSLTGAFNVNSSLQFNSFNNMIANLTFSQYLTLQFTGSISKFFNDPSPASQKANVKFLTISFPYLADSPEVDPYQFNYLNFPGATTLYSDSTMIALMNLQPSQYTTLTLSPGNSINVPFQYTLGAGCNSLDDTYGSPPDCLAQRFLWSMNNSGASPSFIVNETSPINLASIRVGSPMQANQQQLFSFQFNPCIPAGPFTDSNNNPIPQVLVDESLNHPECTTNYKNINGPVTGALLSLSDFSCKTVSAATVSQHRTNPLGSVFTCKMFQWFVKHGKGSSMPITISYNYNNT